MASRGRWFVRAGKTVGLGNRLKVARKVRLVGWKAEGGRDSLVESCTVASSRSQRGASRSGRRRMTGAPRDPPPGPRRPN